MYGRKNSIARCALRRAERKIAFCAALLILLAACVSGKTGEFDASVNSALKPAVTSVPDAAGSPQAVAASRDAKGIQSDFVEGVVLVTPASAAELQDFLRRYDGTVLGDNTIPVPPSQLGISLSDEQRKPTEFVVHVSLGAADMAGLAANARAAGVDAPLEFSSEAGLKTFARVLEARAAGFEAGLNDVAAPQQAFPQAMFASVEQAGANAFAEPRYAATGNQTNLALAWQFLLAHGIQRPVQIAIIDGGFWLDTQGRAQGADSDFTPAPGQPIQYDFAQDDYIADGPNQSGCGAGNPCYWHGTGAAGVAAGIANNNLGYAGAGTFVATPILLKVVLTKAQTERALRTAVAWGADVVSMSFGGNCNQPCRIQDRDKNAIGDAVGGGSRVVFVASAGNGQGNPGVGYDVGDPSFVHPCIEDHVICVGAVSESPALSPMGYSNFGARVTVFAPTNFPVMSYPPSTGPTGPLPISQAIGIETAQTFGGTSASAPFVAGVAAMMKAINPNLSSDEVAQILVDTAHPATAPASRVIDALAAVRRAANGIPMVNDRFENNSLETIPTNLGAAPPYVQPNLNINGSDRDYFAFNAPGASTATINLSYVDALGPVSVFSFESLGAHCAAPALVSDNVLPAASPLAPGHSLTYTVPGGPLRLALKGTDINAYNMNISFASRVIAPDTYEVNDQVAQARYLYTLKLSHGTVAGVSTDPRVTIDANIHAASDVDYYIVRGAHITLAEQVLLAAYSAVSIYGNDSPINLQVFRLNPGNTQGPLVANVGGGSCATEPLEVKLDQDTYYLVRVSGSTGAYSLSNSVFGDVRRIPILVHDKIYEVTHPGEPIEHVVRHPELYVFASDPIYTAVRTPDPRAHLSLLDREGKVVAEGVNDDRGERLSLSDAAANQIYAISVMPQGAEIQPPTLALQWEQQAAVRATDNLVRNPGAETPGDGIADWSPQGETPSAQIIAYAENAAQPSPTDMGPQDRGAYLFAGRGSQPTGGLQQVIAVDSAWREAVDRNAVRADFSAYLGGYRQEGDFAGATLTFVGANQQTLGRVVLPAVGPREREGKTGLWPAEASEPVPAGTVRMVVSLEFTRLSGRTNDGYADNVSLTLSEY